MDIYIPDTLGARGFCFRGVATSTPGVAWIGLVLFSRVYYVWHNREAILRCSEAAGYQLGRRKKVQCICMMVLFRLLFFSCMATDTI